MLDFVYAGMHHSLAYNLRYPEVSLEVFEHPSENPEKAWRHAAVIDTYYNDYGYQNRNHIDRNDLDRFLKKHEPRYGFMELPTAALHPRGEYFHKNPAAEISRDVSHFAVQNYLSHAVAVDFAEISVVAAENKMDVCDVDISDFLKYHRRYTINRNGYYIRQAVREDLLDIVNMYKGDEGFGFTSNHMINNFIKDSSCIAIVACDETTKVVGSYLVRIKKKNNAMHSVYVKVDDSTKGQGLGRVLFEEIIRCLKEIDAPYFYGDVPTHLFDVITFFERMGATFGEPRDNAQKQQLIRWHYYAKEQKQLAFF